MQIWPSLINGNLMNLQQTIDRLSPYAAGWHIDVMDNHFVPNLTWGAAFVNAIAQQTTKPLWVHLMIDNPATFLDTLHLPHGTFITVHVETKSDITATIQAIKASGYRAGLAVNPETPIERAFAYLELIEQLLIMSVNPGFSGQTFMPEVLTKIAPLKAELKRQRNEHLILAMDGGITQKNIVEIAKQGITQFGIASGIFSYADPVDQLKHLNTLVQEQ